jgi:hypothetical protein
MLRALNENAERVFDTPRKDTHWEKRIEKSEPTEREPADPFLTSPTIR